ncbi:MAG: cupredoxin domain-containing protein [Nitrososphaerales archaeon]|nr:cupredoxin domain-containing protein [Nitrososphaerales archaeon]
MKTTEIVALGVAVALVIGLFTAVAYASMANQYRQNFQTSTSLPTSAGTYSGYQGYFGGMMGRGFGYSGGMMGGYGGGVGPYGSMMGGGMMGGYPYGSWSGNPTYARHSGLGGAVVTIANYGFYPRTLTVSNGTTVTWVNMDFVQHTVTSGSEQAPTGLFDSHELNHMQAFSYTFSTPGTYTYYCDVHPDMTGTIVVSA